MNVLSGPQFLSFSLVLVLVLVLVEGLKEFSVLVCIPASLVYYLGIKDCYPNYASLLSIFILHNG